MIDKTTDRPKRKNFMPKFKREEKITKTLIRKNKERHISQCEQCPPTVRCWLECPFSFSFKNNEE